MLIYHYDIHTKALLGSSEAPDDPDTPHGALIPAFATHVVPPAVPDGERAIFHPITETWTLEAIPIPVDQNITEAPDTLFGGPSIQEVFYGQ